MVQVDAVEAGAAAFYESVELAEDLRLDDLLLPEWRAGRPADLVLEAVQAVRGLGGDDAAALRRPRGRRRPRVRTGGGRRRRANPDGFGVRAEIAVKAGDNFGFVVDAVLDLRIVGPGADGEQAERNAIDNDDGEAR